MNNTKIQKYGLAFKLGVYVPVQVLFKIRITGSRNIWIRHDLEKQKRKHEPWLEKKYTNVYKHAS